MPWTGTQFDRNPGATNERHPAEHNYLTLAAVIVLALLILGAGGMYFVFEYQARPTPSGVLILLSMAIQQIAFLLLGRGQSRIGQSTNRLERHVDGNLEELLGKVDYLKERINELEGERSARED